MKKSTEVLLIIAAIIACLLCVDATRRLHELDRMLERTETEYVDRPHARERVIPVSSGKVERSY